ncbi:conserved hypothetical protein [Vibrio cholerae O1 str. 2010EL-1786]|uniref:Uncharacterized protein n=3 Tax=Vibrio cholerae TaxID=666 RepID=Q9KQC9_VIBCH|nr:hypothetical protein VC_2071 [Vibrio cholerae O1 biovar El Tor str. N16961]ACP06297.1 conserved hypothetical protein [Vibrio cholerae M66-2]ACP10178.1 conserved hypothetical protein [Vibrio cholerae O395]AET27161.1 conserved hypothetical protein [Vibrio cholerae O1 str. 2010EL-1786]APF49594.1 hypothetical protein ASZ80_02055 [Vibrio cholerae]EET23276.1 conserved hypothetical protein [Vibrio cholerae MO10]EEY42594.1 hypothetical protein VIJ_000862 [Vibrio cholerae RC27]EEY48911.1 hypotheti
MYTTYAMQSLAAWFFDYNSSLSKDFDFVNSLLKSQATD